MGFKNGFGSLTKWFIKYSIKWKITVRAILPMPFYDLIFYCRLNFPFLEKKKTFSSVEIINFFGSTYPCCVLGRFVTMTFGFTFPTIITVQTWTSVYKTFRTQIFAIYFLLPSHFSPHGHFSRSDSYTRKQLNIQSWSLLHSPVHFTKFSTAACSH